MSTPTSTQVHKYNPTKHLLQPDSYRHISEIPISPTHKLVSFAGQVGTTDKSIPNPSLRDQVRIALDSVDACLEGAGLTKADIISVRQYLVKFTRMSEQQQTDRTEVYGSWWKSTEGENAPPPPLTLIGVDSLYNDVCLFEMEVQCVGRI